MSTNSQPVSHTGEDDFFPFDWCFDTTKKGPNDASPPPQEAPKPKNEGDEGVPQGTEKE